MWRLKVEMQNHHTYDLGMQYETPELAYQAVEAFCAQALKYETDAYTNDTELVYDPMPDDELARYHWLTRQGWPEGGVPVIVNDQTGETMADLGESRFEPVSSQSPILEVEESLAEPLALIDWLNDRFDADVLPAAESLVEAGYKKEAVADHFRAVIFKHLVKVYGV